jgi:hypothetical protein
MNSRQQAVLAANEKFYIAFANHDIVSMESLWSSHHDISVIHPGWSSLHGRQSVMSSWNQIMSTDELPEISCINARVNILGDVALIICTELLSDAKLIATNTFCLESEGWKMIHHQAGPLSQAKSLQEGDILH